MRMVNVGITGVGSYVPETRVSNEDLVRHSDTSVEWILKHTGIKERGIALPDERLPVMMAVAAKRALANAGLSAEDIDEIRVGTNSTDPVQVPALGPRVQYLIGARNIPAQDVGAGCTSGVYAFVDGVRSVRDHKHSEGKNIRSLILGGDALSNTLNIMDRRALPILADGAGAMVIETIPDEDYGVKHMFTKADGSSGYAIYYGSGFNSPLVGVNPVELETTSRIPDHFVMDGGEVHKFVQANFIDSVRELLDGAGFEPDDLERAVIIPHQMNYVSLGRAERRLAKEFGVRPKIFYKEGVVKHGNTSPASTFIATDELYREGQICKGDIVMNLSFGAGLTWGGFLTIWNKEKFCGSESYDAKTGQEMIFELSEKYMEFEAKFPKQLRDL